VIVDTILARKISDIHQDAHLVIAIGPGLRPKDAHYVIETNHGLGRLLSSGSAGPTRESRGL
jgi:hypothetical protein